MTTEIDRLPRMIEQAASRLAKATNAAEVLDVINLAKMAGDAAKSAKRFAEVKDAHDTICSACHKAMADALEIEMRAKCRLADEYDAAQERGEVAGKAFKGNQWSVPQENAPSSTADIGLTRKQVHEARKVRDAERAKPGVVHKAINEQLEAGNEPTRAHVNRALNGSADKTSNRKRKGGPQPQRRTVSDSVDAAAASLVLDQGKTYEQAKTELGLSSVQLIKTAVAREEGRRDPQINRDELSLTDQQKLDAAIRQYERKLDLQFHQHVQEEVRKRIDEIVLPHWKAQIAEAAQLYKRRKGLMDKTTFNTIRRALHPDSRHIGEKMLAAAFDAFMSLEKYLLKEEDSPTEFDPVPNTLAEWDARKREATASRKAKHSTRVPARRH